MHYVFITGGVSSSLGKGLASAALASLLQLRNFKVRIRKLDPYLNVDPGTMNPVEHGEVFVTRDGKETDLDLGYYERFLDTSTTEQNSTSYGKLFQKLLDKERNGDYLGETVQLILAVLLVIFVLLQGSDNEGLGLGGGGGLGGMMSARGSANLLSRLTAITATLFMIMSVILTISASVSSDKNILESLPDVNSSESDTNTSTEPSIPENN